MRKKLFGFVFLIFLLFFIIFLLKILIPIWYFKERNTTIYSEPPNKIPDIISPFVNKPILGIHFRMIDDQTAKQNNIVEGAYITEIIPSSLADKANIIEEDIIIELDGRLTAGLEARSVYDLISTLKPGSKLNLKIWRNKEIKNIIITLE